MEMQHMKNYRLFKFCTMEAGSVYSGWRSLGISFSLTLLAEFSETYQRKERSSVWCLKFWRESQEKEHFVTNWLFILQYWTEKSARKPTVITRGTACTEGCQRFRLCFRIASEICLMPRRRLWALSVSSILGRNLSWPSTTLWMFRMFRQAPNLSELLLCRVSEVTESESFCYNFSFVERIVVLHTFQSGTIRISLLDLLCSSCNSLTHHDVVEDGLFSASKNTSYERKLLDLSIYQACSLSMTFRTSYDSFMTYPNRSSARVARRLFPFRCKRKSSKVDFSKIVAKLSFPTSNAISSSFSCKMCEHEGQNNERILGCYSNLWNCRGNTWNVFQIFQRISNDFSRVQVSAMSFPHEDT